MPQPREACRPAPMPLWPSRRATPTLGSARAHRRAHTAAFPRVGQGAVEGAVISADAMLAEDAARAEAAKRSHANDSEKQKRPRKSSLSRLVAKAKQLGVDVTVEPDGTATFRTGSSASAPVDKPQTEVDEWIAKHAH
jgi:hypothetical protein